MKKVKLLFSLLFSLAIFALLAAAGCGDKSSSGGEPGDKPSAEQPGGEETTDPEKSNYDMSGVEWDYTAAFTYDGTEKSVSLTGLPAGVTVKEYSGNTATNAGTYTATATFEYDEENYNAPQISPCEWTINKAQITGLSFENVTIDYDGELHSLKVKGALPAGTSAVYTYNGVIAEGVSEIDNYEVKVTVSGANYITWEATAQLKIRQPATLANMAQTVIDAFGEVPDFMDFFPETYAKEERLLYAPISYESAVAVSDIPQNGIGKQLHTVYNTLRYTETALGYVSAFYGGFSSIVTLYQDYINSNPDDYKLFEGTWSVFGIRIEIADTDYIIFAEAPGVAIEIYQSIGGEALYARIELLGTASLKISYDGEYLRTAVNVAGVFTSDIDMYEDAATGNITGVLYETTGVGGARLTTCTILTITEDHLIAVGNKGDFAVPGQGANVEVYDNATGYLCGAEVYENVSVAGVGTEYDTLWYNLGDISGISEIAADMGVSDEDNKLNKDTVYINGKDTPFVPEFNSVMFVKTSRQYDIEFKTMYFYTYNAQDESYELTEQLIPMLFVQRDNLSTYLEDIRGNNALSVTPQNLSSAADNAVIAAAYETYVPVYNEVKETLTYEMTIEFIGEKHAWFKEGEESAAA